MVRRLKMSSTKKVQMKKDVCAQTIIPVSLDSCSKSFLLIYTSFLVICLRHPILHYDWQETMKHAAKTISYSLQILSM